MGRRGPRATPKAVCSTLHFLGLQAVSPLLVLLEVGGGSTPVERDEASLLCLPLSEPLSPSRLPGAEGWAGSIFHRPWLPPRLGSLTRAGGRAGPCGYIYGTAAGCTGRGSSRVPQ